MSQFIINLTREYCKLKSFWLTLLGSCAIEKVNYFGRLKEIYFRFTTFIINCPTAVKNEREEQQEWKERWW